MSVLSGVSLDLVRSVDDAQRMLTWLGQSRENDTISIDLETGELPGAPTKDALSPWHGRIRLAQIGDMDHGWAIPWEEWSGLFYEIMSKYEGRIVLHNSAFDLRWLAVKSRWEVPWGRIDDSMIAAQIINPLESAALKMQTSKYIDPRASAMQRLLDDKMVKYGWTWGTVPIDLKEYWAYGALDTVLTSRLWDIQQKDVGSGGSLRLTYDLEMAARQICTKMELNGARVDLEYCKRKYDELRVYADGVKKWGRDTYGVSLTSNRDLINLFENRLGATITELTPSGQKKIDKDQLKRFTIDGTSEVKGLAETVLRLRKAEKLAETYLANALNDHVDGILHPSIRSMGARTGRMSITSPGPALQTLPKKDVTVRSAFIPRDPDTEVLLSSDLDQVEFRMTASLADDPALIELFARCDREGGDSFTEIMRDIYRDPTLQKSDSRRGLVKGTVYGKLYGAGVPKMALTAGVPEPQMRSVVEAFDREYPGVKKFAQKVEDEGMRRLRSEGRAYVTTASGRRLPCDEDKVYTLTNYAIQGGAAEVFKLNLLKCDAAGLTDYLVVPVHDELVISAPRADAEDIGRELQACMTTTTGWRVPLTAGLSKPLNNWGENSD